jgi:hypothetical protein
MQSSFSDFPRRRERWTGSSLRLTLSADSVGLLSIWLPTASRPQARTEHRCVGRSRMCACRPHQAGAGRAGAGRVRVQRDAAARQSRTSAL